MGFILNLRQHLFLSVAVPLSLGMLVCVLAAIIPLYSSINDWNNKTSDAIEKMNIAASTTRMTKLNENLQVIYDQIIHDMSTLRNNTYRMYLLEPGVSYPTYSGDNTIYTRSPPTEDASFYSPPFQTYSATWLKNAVSVAQIVATDNANATSLTDDLAKSIMKASAGSAAAGTDFYFKIMHGFADGFYRRYPFSVFPADYHTSNSYCVGADASTYGIGYDPRCRPWYQQSKLLNDEFVAKGQIAQGMIVFSNPYLDAATKKTTISASSPLYDPRPSGNFNQFMGVVNLDFNMKAISDVVLNSVVSKTGYVFLMTSSGTIISHRLYTNVTAVVSVSDLESGFSAFWINVISAFTSDGTPYQTTLPQIAGYVPDYSDPAIPNAYVFNLASTTDGRGYYVGVTYNPSTGYILAMMLPQDDLNADNTAAYNDLKSSLVGGTVGLCIVLAFLFVCVLIGTHYIARYYARAIKDAALILQQAVKPDVKVQLAMREPVCYEINKLFKQFEPMFVALRFGNTSFYEGNLEKALEDYKMAEALMHKMDNKKGLGKVYNNLGNTYLKKGNLDEAESYYQKAIAIGKEMLTECEKELSNVNHQLSQFLEKSNGDGLEAGAGAVELDVLNAEKPQMERKQSAIGSAVAAVFQEEKVPDEKTHPEAFYLYKKRKLQQTRRELLMQIASRQANLGVLFKNQNKKNKAYDMLAEAMQSHTFADDDLGVARVSSNTAQFYLEENRLSEAQDLIQQTYAKLSAQTNAHAADPLALQYCTMTLGLLTHRQKKYQDAAGWFQYCLQLMDQYSGSVVDSTVQQTCFMHLEQVFASLGNEIMRKKYKQLSHRVVVLKNVLFALDCSGSMAGSQIKRCRSSINEIIEKYIEPEDRVALITFASKSVKVLPLTQRGYDEKSLYMFKDAVETKTVPNGPTALWDALYEGIAEFKSVTAQALFKGNKDEQNRNNWLIGLTDGEDNASAYGPVQVQRALQKDPVHLVLITVGRSYDRKHIESLVKTAKDAKKQGHHITVESDSISQAFESVAKLITAQLNVEVM